MGSAEESIARQFAFYENRGARGDVRIECPECSLSRTKKRDRCLSVRRKDDGAIAFNCWHCGFSGAVQPEQRRPRMDKPIQPKTIVIPEGTLSEKAQNYLTSRSISTETANKFKLFSAVKFFRTSAGQGEAEAIGFPYFVGGKPTAAKYRSLDFKSFTQDGAARSLFGMDLAIDGSDPLVICEGEIDALSMAEAGIANPVSVPSGAPSDAVKDNAGRDDGRFGYLSAAADLLKLFKKFVLAVDGDAPGKFLAEELSRRLGRNRCYTVAWPDGCKDANDVLRGHGHQKLKELVTDAKPWPVLGIQFALHYAARVKELYTNGLKSGLSSGIPGLDPLFTICPGQISVVTGVPSSGKSEFVDQIMVNLAQRYDWRFAIWSIENPPHMHISKLAEKHLVQPFRDGPTQRMSPPDLDRAIEFIDRHFIFMEQGDGGTATIDSILERAEAIVLRNGARGLLIDPYNYIDMGTPDREDRAISDMLTKVRMFAMAYEAHVWFVAHPRRLPPRIGDKPVIPDGNSISGGMAWWAKTDIGLSVHREQGSTRVLIDCWKCRFKWIGQQGQAHLNYDPVTGTYGEDYMVG